MGRIEIAIRITVVNVMRVVLLTGAFALTACGLTPSETASGAVLGHVHVGPMCPQVTVQNPCPDSPWSSGEVRFTPATGGGAVTAKTDSRGEFQIQLPADSYTITLTGPNPLNGNAYERLVSFNGPQSLQVHANQSVRLEFRVESGIR